MKHEKLCQAMDEIRPAYLAEAAAPAKRKSHSVLYAAIAALLAVAVLAAGLLSPGAPLTARAAVLPDYPQMAPYPGDTGNSALWEFSVAAVHAHDPGFADSLAPFWESSIPVLLSGQEGNPVCSPLNIYMALSMLAEITGGGSREELLTLLNAGSMDALRAQAEQVWRASYWDDGAVSTVLANSLWLDSGISCRAPVMDTLASSYYAAVFQDDLTSEQAGAALRDWLNGQTHGFLDAQAAQESFPPNTALALASTIYYRNRWISGFSEADSTRGVFHGVGGDAAVTYLNRVRNGAYFEGADFTAVPLSLNHGDRLWLFLPDSGLTPEDLLQSGNALALALSGGQSQAWTSCRITLSMPKFDVSSSLRLEQALQTLGVRQVFEESTGDFSPISPDAQYLSQVGHNVRIAVDEEGITAAAYTILAIPGDSIPEKEVTFTLDRPFLFVLTNGEDLPLFVGILRQP